MVMMGDNLEAGRACYVFGNYIDEVLMRAVVGSTAIDLFHTHDHLYSTVAVYYAMSGSFGIQERYEYDAYGKAAVYTAGTDGAWFTGDDVTQSYSTVGNGYTFTGRRLDTLDDGGYSVMYYRARYYDTETGRFMQRDPLGIDPAGMIDLNLFDVTWQYSDSLNIYCYVLNSPLQNIDPDGHGCLVYFKCQFSSEKKLDKKTISCEYMCTETRRYDSAGGMIDCRSELLPKGMTITQSLTLSKKLFCKKPSCPPSYNFKKLYRDGNSPDRKCSRKKCKAGCNKAYKNTVKIIKKTIKNPITKQAALAAAKTARTLCFDGCDSYCLNP